MTQATDRPFQATELETAIAQALEEARTACQNAGNNSNECAVAWDIVEELQAERSHREAAKQRNSLDVYCIEHPEAIECLIYDL